MLGDVAKALQARGCGAWGTGPSARWPGQGGPRPGSVGPGVSEGPLGRRQRGATPAGEQLRALAAAARFIANAAAATDQLGISAGGQLPIMASSETDDDADVIYDAINGDADTER